MSSMQQRAELQAQIWKIANDVRGSIDGWDFKQEDTVRKIGNSDFSTKPTISTTLM